MADKHSDIPIREIVEQAAPAEVSEIDLYQRREKIYTRAIEGFFQRLRLFTGWPLLLGYFLMPWLTWDGRQAILFDLPAREFHILFLTFWPQDFSLLAWVLIIGAFGLFTVTNFAGRVWCGYTCPQTVWTSIYMWLEQKVEGSRLQRIKLDRAPWTANKATKKVSKHMLWLGFAFLTGFTFIAYFIPARELALDFFLGEAGLTAYAWILFFTLATYINAGWLREQVCIYMCPYARFQSVMFDQDTLIVSYDPGRGEPRGSRRRDAEGEQLGDCIDCHLCVQVCPVGIDIRDGLQYQCIGCALCIDACDSIMDKMQYPRGLIRYTTENNLQGGKTRILRPRFLGYALVLLVMVGVFATQLATRAPLELGVIRDRQQLFTQSAGGLVENTYRLNIMNKTDSAQRFELRVEGLPGVQMSTGNSFHVEARSSLDVPLRLAVDADQLEQRITGIEFVLVGQDDPTLQSRQDSRFIGPAGGHRDR